MRDFFLINKILLAAELHIEDKRKEEIKGILTILKFEQQGGWMAVLTTELLVKEIFFNAEGGIAYEI